MSVTVRWTATVLVLLLTAAAAAPNSSARPSRPAPPPRAAESSPPATPVAPTTPAASTPPTTPALSALQLAGQRVVYSYSGPIPPESLLADIRAGRAAGVVFFSENFTDARQFGAAVEQLREARRQSGVPAPLLLMTDQEGGLVRRLPGAPELSAKETGQATDPTAAAASAGTAAGRNLSGYGLNVNLAPVLDVYETPGNFIDRHGRSFSSDPSAVDALGSAFVTAQQRAGVAATAKHFPGLGTAATRENTDLAPVTLPVDAATLRSVHEAPYRDAVAAGVALVMLSWAVYPALDANRPAGLSPIVLDQELRGRLGYRGVTVTDALEAGALRDFGSIGDRAVDAAAAGVDLMLCASTNPTEGEDATAALAAALDSGRLDRTTFTAATDRVTALRASLH
ncbi:glycoside hydrolase family 3 N-terminal domain-containing protein [Kitasatospora sp. McL0602]|uniref:glycoside hydrolase family 3 N-terminal domain-containing protein n=1 Tax=Kitasatospora sp. McL0602 TaxID=3439530 RepID=UPI003F8A91EF